MDISDNAAVRVVADGDATEWYNLSVVQNPQLYEVDSSMIFTVANNENLTAIDENWYGTRIQFWASIPAKYCVLYAGS